MVEIKKEMNWDEEERLHQLQRKLQEQVDSSSEEEEPIIPRRTAASRVAPPLVEEPMSGYLTTGLESGYEDRRAKRSGRRLPRHHKPASKRRKLAGPLREIWKPPLAYDPSRTRHCINSPDPSITPPPPLQWTTNSMTLAPMALGHPGLSASSRHHHSHTTLEHPGPGLSASPTTPWHRQFCLTESPRHCQPRSTGLPISSRYTSAQSYVRRFS